ncbi:glucosidase II Gtb1 [Schizosaccharomyces cryophilus OY26]|uniref:Glucosidase 2 subunit beta n=1 Tax=Schizosaccharomyces cryophilus (strain OY26 / ATCC MYA-4695 / CBS 11777 / NBRC 106824 / NRRL Y48691) TaxID=653667 RepID=S9VUE8_SCHCR|nr:glucosidase II Gtb1 [Schizosaccharomyces cryophilus OY26]EPY49735.1 glucosidase II Gtb1 [Schizosaccharomyces cryophilus OY26]
MHLKSRNFLAALFGSLLFSFVNAKLSIRGISESELHLYKPTANGQWKCLGSDKTIGFEQINDDYCDCPDGSDEPGTSACSNGKFFCKNDGYISKYIPSNWVDDTKCDCCDGSDESLIKCENTCKKEAEVYKQSLTKHNQLVNDGLKIRDDWIAQSAVMKKETKRKYDSVSVKITEIEKLKKELENTVQTLKQSPESDSRFVLSTDLEEIKNDLFNLLDERNEYNERLSALENLLDEISLQYETDNFDGTLKEALDSWEDLKSQNIKRKVSSEKIHNDLESSLTHLSRIAKEEATYFSFFKKIEKDLTEIYWNVKRSLIDFGILSPSIPATLLKTAEGGSYLERIHSDLDAAEDELENLHKEQATLLEDLQEHHNGWDNLYRFMKGMKTELKVGDYLYKILFFENVYQDSINLGSFSEQSGNTLKYLNGQSCWNGPDRSATVVVDCGTENEIVSVLEAQKCEYTIKMKSPAACSPSQFQTSLLKDDNDVPDEL